MLLLQSHLVKWKPAGFLTELFAWSEVVDTLRPLQRYAFVCATLSYVRLSSFTIFKHPTKFGQSFLIHTIYTLYVCTICGSGVQFWIFEWERRACGISLKRSLQDKKIKKNCYAMFLKKLCQTEVLTNFKK